jgi:hypothetical protein
MSQSPFQQRLASGGLLEADEAEGIDDGMRPGTVVLVVRVVAQQDQQVCTRAGTAGRAGPTARDAGFGLVAGRHSTMVPPETLLITALTHDYRCVA